MSSSRQSSKPLVFPSSISSKASETGLAFANSIAWVGLVKPVTLAFGKSTGFAVGLISEKNPEFLSRRHHYELAVEHFRAFCAYVWLPAGIIGIPMFLISLIISLVREKKDNGNQ